MAVIAIKIPLKLKINEKKPLKYNIFILLFVDPLITSYLEIFNAALHWSVSPVVTT